MIYQITGEFPEGQSPRIIARVRTDDGFLLDNSQVTSWDFAINDLSSATPGTDILITPQTGQVTAILVGLTTTGWDLDETGGNFFQRVANTLVTGGFIGMRTYRFQWTLHTGASYGDIFVRAVLACKSSKG